MSEAMALRLAYISGGFPVWALFVAQERGLFAAHGLQVAITHTGSSVAQMQGLREGSFDLGLQLPDHVVRATATGCPMLALAAQTHPPDVALVAAPRVRSLQDLQGQRIAVDGARSGYALLLAQLLQSQGLQYEFVEVGGSQERVDALRQGQLAASFINPPLDKALVADGFVRLTSTREAFPHYPGPVVASRREWANANPQALAAFQAAWAQAWDWLIDPATAADAVALAVRHLGADAAASTRALEALRARGVPRFTEEGMQAVIDLVWRSEGHTQTPPSPASLMRLQSAA